MARLKKRMALVAGVVIFVLLVLYVALWLIFTPSGVPSNIVDFRPASFQATAATGFFYSIANELKYSDQIDPQAPTLMRGQIKNFLVSPDNKKDCSRYKWATGGCWNQVDSAANNRRRFDLQRT